MAAWLIGGLPPRRWVNFFPLFLGKPVYGLDVQHANMCARYGAMGPPLCVLYGLLTVARKQRRIATSMQHKGRPL